MLHFNSAAGIASEDKPIMSYTFLHPPQALVEERVQLLNDTRVLGKQ